MTDTIHMNDAAAEGPCSLCGGRGYDGIAPAPECPVCDLCSGHLWGVVEVGRRRCSACIHAPPEGDAL